METCCDPVASRAGSARKMGFRSEREKRGAGGGWGHVCGSGGREGVNWRRWWCDRKRWAVNELMVMMMMMMWIGGSFRMTCLIII
jgi:hypothetical protein